MKKKSLVEKCVDAKQGNANILSPKQAVPNKSELQTALRVVCNHNPKEINANSNYEADHMMLDENNFLRKSLIKDDFFEKLLNDIEESIKGI